MPHTSILDNLEAIKKLDASNVLGSIEQLGDQVQHVWQLAQQVKISHDLSDVDYVVVAGMGGSALGTHVIQSVYKDELKVPVIICPDYQLPNFVTKKTLVVTSSYSGNTEETLAAATDAMAKQAKVIGITTGGQLAELLKKHHQPALIFEPTFNPSNQPRMGLGYSIFGQIVLLSIAKLIKVNQSDYDQVLTTIADCQLKYSVHVKQAQNAAKLLAFELKERIPVITVAEHLEGAAHVFANQLNENSKNYSEYRVIPEMNHHLMEGLMFPSANNRDLFFVLIDSKLYLKSNQKRVNLTGQVLEKNHIDLMTHHLTAKTKLTQTFELLTLGAYANFYLSMLNNVNPAPIPWVDWFKAQL